MFFVVDSRILLVFFCCIRVTCVFLNVLRLKCVVSAMHHNLFDALFRRIRSNALLVLHVFAFLNWSFVFFRWICRRGSFSFLQQLRGRQFFRS